jgi:hypothetical protein
MKVIKSYTLAIAILGLASWGSIQAKVLKEPIIFKGRSKHEVFDVQTSRKDSGRERLLVSENSRYRNSDLLTTRDSVAYSYDTWGNITEEKYYNMHGVELDHDYTLQNTYDESLRLSQKSFLTVPSWGEVTNHEDTYYYYIGESSLIDSIHCIDTEGINITIEATSIEYDELDRIIAYTKYESTEDGDDLYLESEHLREYTDSTTVYTYMYYYEDSDEIDNANRTEFIYRIGMQIQKNYDYNTATNEWILEYQYETTIDNNDCATRTDTYQVVEGELIFAGYEEYTYNDNNQPITKVEYEINPETNEIELSDTIEYFYELGQISRIEMDFGQICIQNNYYYSDFVDNQEDSVEQFNLVLENYPNPFNPETTIMYNIPVTDNTNLAIYNLKGQLVKELVNEKQTAGNHQVIWNGLDESNQRVASGVYLYKIRSDKYSKTNKMILMK